MRMRTMNARERKMKSLLLVAVSLMLFGACRSKPANLVLVKYAVSKVYIPAVLAV